MDHVILWPALTAAVQTAYPQVSQSGGRPPIPLERMLRIYFLQLWFNLSDPAVEALGHWLDAEAVLLSDHHPGRDRQRNTIPLVEYGGALPLLGHMLLGRWTREEKST